MATKGAGEQSPRPGVGDTLIVIHDFQARSSDELSLSKGDRVELIERDDEFGDGWFLGRHLGNENSGLFPEVYTRPAPKNIPPIPSTKSNDLSSAAAKNGAEPLTSSSALPRFKPPTEPPPAAQPVTKEEQISAVASSNSVPTPPPSAKVDPIGTTTKSTASSLATDSTAASSVAPSQSQDNQVLNETLNVINEHITDLRGTSPSRGGLRVPGPSGDSASEYSVPLDQRRSYIQGEETDEEEDRPLTRNEVASWTAAEVSQRLFAAGVEQPHCDVFQEQEITGEVLLGMDQSSLFIKAFDLGSVGRRLKTWHKIKALQDEVQAHESSTRRTTLTRASYIGSDDTRANTSASSFSNRPFSSQAKRLSQAGSKLSPGLTSPLSPDPQEESPTRPGHVKRPSAASVRDLHHARRHSSTDYRAPLSAKMSAPALTPNGTTVGDSMSPAHKKQASFDRNWTIGSAFSQKPSRPLSSAGLQGMLESSDQDQQDSAIETDRGYLSNTEADGRRRNVLKKRDSTAHSRLSSYADEQRVRSATALSRHSRFGSVDSFQDPAMSPAMQKYYGVQPGAHRRTASTNTTESIRHPGSMQDGLSAPMVTRLETGSGLGPAARSPVSPPSAGKSGFGPDWLSAVVGKPKSRPGMRVLSDRLANRPKDITTPDLAMDSPGRTASSTNSAEPSLDLDSPGTGKSFSGQPPPVPAKGIPKKKSKKETSAYQRGLQKVGPLQAQREADYSGWMKKKSSNLMTTWKPRLFVLKGRRLAYYYSEDDDQERGLIDISFHRVLPAGNEKLTGLHATITGAGAGAVTADGEKSNEQVFIFKLVPPRAGLSRAVNFTKPTVHYFAVPNVQQGRLWMAALMKATIDRDDNQPITSTYQQKTISLTKAKQMRHRPPALMNLDEKAEDEPSNDDSSARQSQPAPTPSNGLGIIGESDSGVSGMDKLAVAAAEAGNTVITSSAPVQSA